MKKHDTKKFSSKYNGEIELRKGKGGYMLIVDGFLQSGPGMEAIWNETFEKLLPDIKILNVLILGFGTGSVINPIRDRWPQSLISGIEIDPAIIQIAEEYFPDNTKRVSITNADAIDFVSKMEKKITYDLIVVDCYIGGKQPENTKTLKFLVNLRQIGKHVIFNQLFLSNNINEMKKIEFLKNLDRLYPVKALKLPNNIIIGF